MTSLQTRFDVVLPVHPYKGDRLDLLRAAVGLRSFQITGADRLFGGFHVVHPPGCAALVEPLRALGDKVHLVDEEGIFSTREYAAVVSTNGWRRQQFVKLAADRLSAASAFLTCDADVSSIGSLGQEMLERDGRLVVRSGRQQESWVRSSFRLLGETPPSKLISVTPVLLAREGLLLTQSRFGDAWVERLAEASSRGADWSEYMIYQAALQNGGGFDRLHTFADEPPLSGGVWVNEKDPPAAIARARAKAAPFLVYQSIREDFFEAQEILRAASLPSFSDVPDAIRAAVLLALAEHGDRERQWSARMAGRAGQFHDEDAALLRGRAPGARAALSLLMQLAKAAEATLPNGSSQLLLEEIEARLSADATVSRAVRGDAIFAATWQFLRGEGEAPAELIHHARTRGVPARLFELIVERLIERQAHLCASTLVAERLRYGRVAPATINRIAGALVIAGEPRALFPLARRALRQNRHNPPIWHELAKAWTQLGRPKAAAYAKARRDRLRSR